MTQPTSTSERTTEGNVSARVVLTVCAHPDDESFGLGGVIGTLAATGSTVSLLCFTHGEASTLGNSRRNLGAVRCDELRRAGDVLGLAQARLLDHPDGGLSDVPMADLVGEIVDMVARTGADTLLVFDPNGVTGHPDHRRATEAAFVAAEGGGLALLGWMLPVQVAARLNREFGAHFIGRRERNADIALTVDRPLQWRAIAEHNSQCTDNPVLERRLQLMGNTEWLSWLRLAGGDGALLAQRRAHLSLDRLPPGV